MVAKERCGDGSLRFVTGEFQDQSSETGGPGATRWGEDLSVIVCTNQRPAALAADSIRHATPDRPQATRARPLRESRGPTPHPRPSAGRRRGGSEDYVQARKLSEAESLTSMETAYRKFFKPRTRRVRRDLHQFDSPRRWRSIPELRSAASASSSVQAPRLSSLIQGNPSRTVRGRFP